MNKILFLLKQITVRWLLTCVEIINPGLDIDWAVRKAQRRSELELQMEEYLFGSLFETKREI